VSESRQDSTRARRPKNDSRPVLPHRHLRRCREVLRPGCSIGSPGFAPVPLAQQLTDAKTTTWAIIRCSAPRWGTGMTAEEDVNDYGSGRQPAGGLTSPTDALTAALMTKSDPKFDADTRAYLREQTDLARLQKENLRDQNKFEISHLRWRRFNDQMKGAMQIMIVVVGAIAVIALGAALWNASQADGLVVEQFSVPPAFIASGIAGSTVADDLTQKIDAIRKIASGRSLGVSKDVRNERDEEVHVDIPDTGISFAELWRYLRAWLGHERTVSGNVREGDGGRIALTVAMADVPAFTLEGARSDLSKLEQQAAERLFGTIDPVNYVLYLVGQGRGSEAIAVAAMGPSLLVSPRDRADAYALWAFITERLLGDPYLAIQRANIAIAIDPKLLVATRALMNNVDLLGHTEAALALANSFHQFRREDQPLNQQGSGFDVLLDAGEYEYIKATGDFAHGLAAPCRVCSWSEAAMYRAEFLARLHDVGGARTAFGASLASDPSEKAFSGLTQFYIDGEAGNWKGAVSDIESYETDLRASKDLGQKYVALRIKTRVQPLLALALAEQGDFAAAKAAIEPTPVDCVPCTTTRGEVAALSGDTGVATVWFARAVHDAPSAPFAATDWGKMLLAHGHPEDAIEKFEQALAKAPHFADTLEMWGEALMQKNRSDLALVEFREADKYAPRWGRLHLKWGEALSYLGRQTEARAQYQAASGMYLSAADRTRIASDSRASSH